MKLIFKAIGFKNVIELDDLESIEWEHGSITAVPFLGEHSDLNIRSKTAYAVRLCDRVLMFAADSCNIEPRLYEYLHDKIGDVDALFLGMECDGAPGTWLYGPLLTTVIERAMDESRRLAGSNFEQAIDLVKRFNCKAAYVYAMGQEPWMGYIMSLKYNDQSGPIVESNRLVSECLRQGINAERLFGEKEVFVDALSVPSILLHGCANLVMMNRRGPACLPGRWIVLRCSGLFGGAGWDAPRAGAKGAMPATEPQPYL